MQTLSWDDIAGSDGRDVRVALIDSGVEPGHPALADAQLGTLQVDTDSRGVLQVSRCVAGDQFGHGTAVASILHRYAPGASIDSLRVLDGSLRSTTFRIAHAMRWAIDTGHAVINCSFGARGSRHLDIYKEIVDRAFCAGTVIIAACNNLDYRQPEYPGAFPSVVSTDFGDLAALDVDRRAGELVEFVSAGIDLHVAWLGGTHRKVSGSSFAAPHLSALVARIKQLRPGWNSIQVKAQLYALAERKIGRSI